MCIQASVWQLEQRLLQYRIVDLVEVLDVLFVSLMLGVQN
jgi:hypothetical protein